MNSFIINNQGVLLRYKGADAHVVIPEAINNIVISSIDKNAFASCYFILSLSIPSSVSSIDPDICTDCVNLFSIHVSKENSFYSDIDGVLFNKSQTKLYIYPAKQSSIKSLGSYYIPLSTQEISDNAFIGCQFVKRLFIPKSIKKTGKLFLQPSANLAPVGSPESTCFELREIEPQQISYHSNFYSIYEVKSFYSDLLANSDLEAIDYSKDFIISPTADAHDKSTFLLTNSETQIETLFFTYPSLTHIFVEKDNPNYTDIDGVLYSKDKKSLISYPPGRKDPSYHIPDFTETISKQAFFQCQYLEQIFIPASVKEIQADAYQNCGKQLKTTLERKQCSDDLYFLFEGKDNITIDAPGIGAFFGCIRLKEIFVSEQNSNYSDISGVLFDKLQYKLYCYPSGRKEISYQIPDTVHMIADTAFSNYLSLQQLLFPNQFPYIGMNYLWANRNVLFLKATDKENVYTLAEDLPRPVYSYDDLL